MATLLQKNLAQNIVKAAKSKKRINKKDLLVISGYSESSATSVPSRVIEQKGVQEELKSLGFSEDNAKRVVREVMDNKFSEDKDRLKAAELVFKVFGTFAAEKSFNLSATASVDELKDVIQSGMQRFKNGSTEPRIE